jgi:integrase
MATTIDMTIKAVEAIPAPATGRAEYRDAKTAGLYLRVSSTGVKTFSFVGRAKGSARVERVTLGKFPAVKPEEAKRRATMMSGEMASGTSAAAAHRGKRQEQTLQTVAELYFKSLAMRGGDADGPRSVWALYVAPSFGQRRMSDITALELERWHRGMPQAIRERRAEEQASRARAAAERRARIEAAQAGRRRGPDPKPKQPSTSSRTVTGEVTANKALELVRTVYRWASQPQRAYFAGVSPATGHDLFPKPSRERFLRPDELRPFFEALGAEPSPAMRDFILLALLTGARRSNVAAMAWSELDLDRAEWRVPGVLMKNDEPQTITLAPEAVEILRARKEARQPGSKSRFVFPSAKAESGHIEDPRRAWDRVLRASGLTDLRLHDLRRTLGSWQARTGASLLLIGKSLNHKDQASSAIYARLDLDPVRQSVDRATTAMFEAAGLKTPAKVIPLPSKAA